MKKSPLFAACAALALLGCDGGTDRPSPNQEVIKSENQQRQNTINNNPNIPAEARERINATIGGGKR